jgi:hypothetical protein
MFSFLVHLQNDDDDPGTGRRRRWFAVGLVLGIVLGMVLGFGVVIGLAAAASHADPGDDGAAGADVLSWR